MLSDARTLEALDFASVRAQVVAQTVTDRGRELAAGLGPSSSFDEVRQAQAAVAAMARAIAARDLPIAAAADPRAGVSEVRRGSVMTAAALRELADSCAVADAAARAVREANEPALAALVAPHRPLNELVSALRSAIDDRGTLLDSASPELSRLRRAVAASQDEVRTLLARAIRSSRYADAIQESIVTIRQERFVIPVKAEKTQQVPGIVHDTSASGATVFIEPLDALEANNRVRTTRLQEEREVQRILRTLSALVARESAQIEANATFLGVADLLRAKARYGVAMRGNPPELVDEPHLAIVRGRHPLLGERAVDQTFTLDATTRFLVISGPNMGGKTVTLKMVGLFVLMAYAGLPLPAVAPTTIGHFSNVFTDIGDEQSIEQNASTFSAHLARIATILEHASERSLILIDELGGGTEPAAGAALAVALLEHFLRIGAHGIVTTHASELKVFAHGRDGVANASVRFDPQTFVPSFHLDVGVPGQSLAFVLARAMGLPAPLIRRAEELGGTHQRDYENALLQIGELRSRLEQQSVDLAAERRHIEALGERVRARLGDLEHEKLAWSERAAERLRVALRDFSEELAARSGTRPKVSSTQAKLLARVLDDLHRELQIGTASPSGSAATGLEAGDLVHVPSLGTEAEVIAVHGDAVLVGVGAMKTSVPLSEVRRLPARSGQRSNGGADHLMYARAGTQVELDVRGMRFADAQPLVERWIDQATLAGHSPLRLIHGKGTGQLGKGLQEYLREHPSVANVRYGNEEEKGSGVTIFELR